MKVNERADHVATFRWIEVRLMEMLAAWVPTTPEMEVKLVFGAHIWDTAQHADVLGKRVAELRLPIHTSLPPCSEYQQLLDEIAVTEETNKRVACLYDVLFPDLEIRYRRYLDHVDQLLDGPTVRVIDRILYDMHRMSGECGELRHDIQAARDADERWVAALRQRGLEIAEATVARQPAKTGAGSE